MYANSNNIYGLTYNSLELTLSSSSFAEMSPGHNVSGYVSGNFYVGTAEPTLQTVSYYFGQPGLNPLPGYQDGTFSVTNTTPLIVGSVGTPMLIAGYAKQAVLNGYSNVFAYLGQYFTNAFVLTNGDVTTNSAGILSEYGNFFPTVPGQVALFTKPDPDQTNIQGACVVDIIRLSLDVNHDGIMNETFTGPDNTSFGNPYMFWVNNDYDRWTDSDLDGYVEDDVASNSPFASCYGVAAVNDSQYFGTYGNRLIPCCRDLEDFARLWVSGVSNTLSMVPSGSTVNLSWAGEGNSPTIDLFQAADSNGGIGYLTNLTTASNQINTNLCQYIGRLGPGSNLVLNSSVYSNGWAGNYYIWCGVAPGQDQLNLTISNAVGSVLAQSSQGIQIQDIKQMYERWTVGDEDTNTFGILEPITPATTAELASDNFSPGMPQTQFAYDYDARTDTNLDYILFVHGYNMASWEKDRYAETAYKRLYWQGYQGRFAEFRWPTYDNFAFYDLSEAEAWPSAVGLENLLTSLNGKYPGNVYVLAHSMGNVVAGEALRLAGTTNVVNTYVASQAAISARAYNNTVPADITNYSYFVVKTPDSEGHYYTNGAPPYFNGISAANNFVDFYNNVDWALDKWIVDQAQ